MVQSEGGFETVTRNCDWKKVMSKIGYKEAKNIAPMLCQSYEKILYPYDIFMSGATASSKVQTCVKITYCLYVICNFWGVAAWNSGILRVVDYSRIRQLSLVLFL